MNFALYFRKLSVICKMICVWFLASIVFFLICDSCRIKPDRIVSEVCIYGNSSASVIAAVQLKISGRNVVIVSPDDRIGGMSIEGLGGSDINNHSDFKNDSVIGGLALDFYKKTAARYGITYFDSVRKNSTVWRFEPHVAEQVIEKWLSDHHIPVYRECRLIQDFRAVDKKDSKILSFKTENNLCFHAKIFIDCSYEGDLLYYSGISTIIGRESNSTYGETKNGIRTINNYRNFEVPVDPYVVPGQPESGLIHTVQDEDLGADGEADHRIQAYCFRACLTNDPSNRVPFTEPDNYNRDWYEIYLRYIEAGGELYSPYVSIPNNKTDLGAWHDLSHNLYGMNHKYPAGNYSLRDSIYKYHLDFTKGLFYFLSHDPSVPGSVRNKWKEWGTSRDEFRNNEGWPRMIYIRDARRMISDYVITEYNTRKDTNIITNDPAGIAFWPPDVHHVRRIVKDGKAYNEGFVFGGDNWKPFQISYRSLIPKKSECTNIMTPTCLSASHIAFGAIRLEWTFMVLGQSAAIAADLCLEKELDVQDLPYELLREKLMKSGQIIEVK